MTTQETGVAFAFEDLLARSAELRERVLRVGVRTLEDGTPSVLSWLSGNGYSYQHIVSERPDLETVFLTLTGRRLRD